jgi:hypothetical protein
VTGLQRACARGVAATLWQAHVHAHLMPAQQGTVNVLDDSAFVVLMVPVTALQGADDNHDSRLSNAEILRHDAALQAQVRARFRVYTTVAEGEGAWTLGKQPFVSIRAEHDDDEGAVEVVQGGAGAKHVLVLLKAQFDGKPHAIRLETDLFGASPAERTLTIRATRKADAAQARLTPEASSCVFFEQNTPPTASPTHAATPWFGWLAIGGAFLTIAWLTRAIRSGRSAPA